MQLARRNEEHYNENALLGEAITDAVAMADILEGWPAGLPALAEVVEKKEDQAEGVGWIMHSGEPLALSLKESVWAVPIKAVHGLCALLWARPREATLSLDLKKKEIGAEGLAALARGMTPTLTSLNLEYSNCANSGGDHSGLVLLGKCLSEASASGGFVAAVHVSAVS